LPIVAAGTAAIGLSALALRWWLRNARGGIFGTPPPERAEPPDDVSGDETDRPRGVQDHAAPASPNTHWN
jgi:hypothetical protein